MSMRWTLVVATMSLVVASCSNSSADTQGGADSSAMACTGSDEASGLDVFVDWNEGEQRQFTRTTVSNGAGVPPDIAGIEFTSPLTMTFVDQTAERGVLLDIELGVRDPDEPSLTGLDGVAFQAVVDVSGELIDPLEGAEFDEINRDIDTYHLVIAVDEGEVLVGPATMVNPLTASVEDAILTVEHLGTDNGGCEVIRATRHIGPDAVIADLDALLDELANPDERPDAFADVGFEGAVVQTTTYRFDHSLGRFRSVEFTEAWGIFGAGGIDTRVETRVLTDLASQ